MSEEEKIMLDIFRKLSKKYQCLVLRFARRLIED